MRATIFNAIISKLNGLAIFQGDQGSLRVYDYPITVPVGYPYAVVASDSFISDELDNQRDSRTYRFTIQIVGEKFGKETGDHTQAEALSAMRAVEDTVIAAFDADNDLGVSGVIITRPVSTEWGYTEGNAHVVLNMTFDVLTTVDITL